ncbi:MAG: diaminopimelate decarboxylase [Terriglobales bacterium]
MKNERRNSKLFARPPAFTYDAAAVLHCDDVALPALAEKFGTPLYVYSGSTIRQRYLAFDAAFGDFPHTVCYSVKANSNLSILRMLAEFGCGFDVVSGGELQRVLRAGHGTAARVVFSGVGKTQGEIDAAIRAGILMFNIESEGEFALLAQRAAHLRKTARVAVRVNPDVSADTHPYISTGLHKHKFGVPMAEARKLYRVAGKEKYLEVAGVSAHIGSQIIDVSPFAESVTRLAELAQHLRRHGLPIRYLDAGGGLGINYHPHAPKPGTPPPLTIGFAARADAYAKAITEPLRGLDLHLLLEPGRSIVGPAGVLLTRVLYQKSNDGKRFLVVDAAMNDLIRPALYGAHHEVVAVTNRARSRALAYDIVGPVCESGDFFARDREMPAVKAGDLLAILDAGAYGMSLASNYNSRPRPAEVMVDGRSIRLIRRRESIADLISSEC